MTPLERAKEAIASAIVAECAKRGGSCNGTPDGLLAVNATFDPTDIARAVLTAIREPSEGMVMEAQLSHRPDSTVRTIWAAMIDAALSEGA